MKILKNLPANSALAVAVFMLTGCGGGGGSAPSPQPTPPPTNVSTQELTTTQTGYSMTFSLSGSDTAGHSYSGSQSFSVIGPTTYENLSVIEKDSLFTLTQQGAGTFSSLAKQYIKASDHSLYKIYYPATGLTAVPTSQGFLPATINVGDFGLASVLSYSNGNTISTNWSVSDGGNGRLKYTLTGNTNGGLSEADSLFIDSTGHITGGIIIVYNFPSAGITTTLNATRQ